MRSKEFLTVNYKAGSIKTGLIVVEFKDHDHIVRYVPSLNLSGYGASSATAHEMLDHVVHDYFKSLFGLSESKMYEELRKLGWVPNKIFKKKLSNQAYVDKDGILKNFNLSAETEIKEHFVSI